MKKLNYILKLIIIGMLFMSFTSNGQNSGDSLQYTLDLNLSGRKISGTFNQLVAGGGIHADIRYKHWHLENTTSYRYNETNTRLIENNWYELALLKYYPMGQKILYPGVFYHFDNSLLYRVNNRHHYGFGLGSELKKGIMKLSVISGIAHENSTFKGSEFANSNLNQSSRKNGLFLFQLNNDYTLVKKKITLSYQLFYFQSLREQPDYDLWINARINCRIYQGLSFHVVYDYRFENVHLEALSSDNAIILFGFNWRIKDN